MGVHEHAEGEASDEVLDDYGNVGGLEAHKFSEESQGFGDSEAAGYAICLRAITDEAVQFLRVCSYLGQIDFVKDDIAARYFLNSH